MTLCAPRYCASSGSIGEYDVADGGILLGGDAIHPEKDEEGDDGGEGRAGKMAKTT